MMVSVRPGDRARPRIAKAMSCLTSCEDLTNLRKRDTIGSSRGVVLPGDQELSNRFRHFGRCLLMRPVASVVECEHGRLRKLAPPPVEQVRSERGVLQTPDDRRGDRPQLVDT